jgi:hypothetical protein
MHPLKTILTTYAHLPQSDELAAERVARFVPASVTKGVRGAPSG